MIAKIKPIDSLRGIAAFLVAFVWHYVHFGVQIPIQKLGWVKTNGWLLVDLFFILSSFIFMHVYKDAIINQSISLKKYIVNRLSRLYPLHFFTLFLVVIFQSVFLIYNENCLMYQNFDFFHFLLNVFFIQYGFFENGYSFNGPSWSISIEMIGYLLFFWTLNYAKNNNITYFFIFLAFIFLGLAIQKHHLEFTLFNSATSKILISFFVGCLIFEFNNWMNKQGKKNLYLLILGITFLVFLILKYRFGDKILGNANVYTLFIFPVILLFSINISLLSKILSNPVTTFLGDISYTVYMLHFPIQLIIICTNIVFELNINFSTIYFLLIYIFLVISFSALIHFKVEKKIMNYIRNQDQSNKLIV